MEALLEKWMNLEPQRCRYNSNETIEVLSKNQWHSLSRENSANDGIIIMSLLESCDERNYLYSIERIPSSEPDSDYASESNYFQVNHGVEAVYSDADNKLESLKIKEKAVQDDSQYTLCLQEYHFKNSVESLNITSEELTKLGNEKVLTTSAQDVLEEYFGSHQNLNSHVEGRLVIATNNKKA